MNQVNNRRISKKLKYRTTVLSNNHECQMEVDSGSDFSIISEDTFKQVSNPGNTEVQPLHSVLTDFLGNAVVLKGMCIVNVKYGTFDGDLKLLVAYGQRTDLLVVDWFEPLGIEITGVHAVSEINLEDVLAQNRVVFQEDL